MLNSQFSPCFYSLKPARLVWKKGLLDAPAGSSDVGKKNSEKAKKAPEELVKMREDQEKIFQDILTKHEKEIRGFIRTHHSYEAGDWKKWNGHFLEAAGIAKRKEENGPYFLVIAEGVVSETVLSDNEIARLVGRLQAPMFRMAKIEAKADRKFGRKSLEALAQLVGQPIPKELSRYIRPEAQANMEVKERLDKEQLFWTYDQVLTDNPRQKSESFISEVSDLSVMDGPHVIEGAHWDEMKMAEVFYFKVAPFIYENQENYDLETLEGWRKVFYDLGLTNEDIEELGLKAESSQKNESQEPPKNTNEEIAQEVKALDLATPEEAVKKAVNLFKEKTNSNISFLRSDKISMGQALGKKALLDNVKTLKDNPGAWNNFIVRQNLIGPKEAFDDYKKKYDEFKKTEASGSNFEAEFNIKEAAYSEMEKAAENYFEKQIKAIEEAQANYEVGLRQISEKYDFPRGMPLELFDDPEEAQAILRNNDFTRYLDDGKGADIITNGVLPNIIKKYTLPRLPAPNRAIKTQADFLVYLKGSNAFEKTHFANQLWTNIKAYNRDPINMINAWIYYDNAEHFARDHQALKKSINDEMANKMEKVRNMSQSQLNASNETLV